MDDRQTPNDNPITQDTQDTQEAIPRPAPSYTSLPVIEPVSWESVEGVRPNRGKVWYIVFSIIGLGSIALAVALDSVSFAILLIIIMVAIIVLHVLPPKTMNYSISEKGIYVGDHLHDYSEFRSFGVQKQDEISSAVLMPIKRFSLATYLYFPEDKGEKIVDTLGANLPLQEIKIDWLDKFVNLIKL